MQHRARVEFHTVDYEPFINSQLDSTQLTVGPFVVQMWSHTMRMMGVPKPSQSAEWKERCLETNETCRCRRGQE